MREKMTRKAASGKNLGKQSIFLFYQWSIKHIEWEMNEVAHALGKKAFGIINTLIESEGNPHRIQSLL